MFAQVLAKHAETLFTLRFRKIGTLDIGSIEDEKKGMLVDALEDFAHLDDLGERNDGEDDFRVFGGKPAFCLDERRAALHIFDDGAADRLVLLRDDEEHFLRVDAVDRAVREDARNVHGKQRVERDLDVENGHRDDDEYGVGDEAGRADVDAVFLLHDHPDEIDSAGRGVGAEDETASDTVQDTAEERSKKEVVGRQVCREEAAGAFKEHGVDDEAVDGEAEEGWRNLFAEEEEKRDVDHEERDGHGNAEREVENACHADSPVREERERREHEVDADSRDDAPEEDQEVLLQALVATEEVGTEK